MTDASRIGQRAGRPFHPRRCLTALPGICFCARQIVDGQHADRRRGVRWYHGVSAQAFTLFFIRRMSFPFAMLGEGIHCAFTVARPRLM